MKKLLFFPIAVLLVFCFMAAPSVVLAQEYLGPGHSAALVIGNRTLCDHDPCVQPQWPLWGFWANMEDAKCLLGLENVMEDGIMGVEEPEDLELPWNSNGPVAMAVDEENERLFVSYLFSRTLQVYGLDDDKNPYLIPGGLPVDIPDYHDVFDGEEYAVSPDEFWDMIPWFWPRFNLNRFCEIVNRFHMIRDRITDPGLVPAFGDAPVPPELNGADWEAIRNWSVSTFHLYIKIFGKTLVDLNIPYDAVYENVNVLTMSFGLELVDWAAELQDWITTEDGALEEWARDYFDDIYSEMTQMLCDIEKVQSNLNTAVLALVRNDVNLRNNILMLWHNVATMREYIENLYALMEDKSVITGLSWVPETNRLYAVAYGLPWVYVYQYYNGEYVRMFDEEFSLCCDECLEPVCVEASNQGYDDEECISLTQPVDIDVLDGKLYVTYRESLGSFCDGASCICVFDIETGEKVDFQCPECQCGFEGFSGAKAIAVVDRENGCGESETLIFSTNTGLCDAECAPDDCIHSEVSSWGYQVFPELYLRDDLVAISCYEETPPMFQEPNGVISLWNVENEAGCCLDLNVDEQACFAAAEAMVTDGEPEPLSYRWDAKGIDVYPGEFQFECETYEGLVYVAAERVTNDIEGHEDFWINMGAGLFLIGYRFNEGCPCGICEMKVIDYWETEEGNFSPADVVALDSVNLDFVIPDKGDKSGSLDGTPWIIDWEVCSPDLTSPDVSISERNNPTLKDGSDVLFFGMDISNPENNICFLDAYLYVPCELEKEVQKWLSTFEWGVFANIEWEKATDIEGVDSWKIGEDLFGCRLHIFYSKEEDGDLLDLFTENDIFGFGSAEFFLPELEPAPEPEPEPSPEPDTSSSSGGGCNAGSAGVSSILLLLPMLFLYFRK